VSDATREDCLATIDFLLHEGSESTKTLAQQMKDHVQSGRFVLQNDVFWCQPTAFWDMPRPIQDKVSKSKLVFVKGDANYRRLLGERDWPLHTSSRTILSYWPVPVCALRTFKAEIGCGVCEQDQARASAADSKWMVSGRWGVVQLGGDGII
jgi:Damage-control phosphatase ARMT1-like domain